MTVGDAATAVILDDSPEGNEKLELVEMTTCSEPAHLCLGMPSTENTGIALYTKNIKLHDSGNLRIWPHMAKRIFTFIRRGKWSVLIFAQRSEETSWTEFFPAF